MTKQELNRDIKMLAKRYKDSKQKTNADYFAAIEPIKKEFSRLYYADRTAESLTAASLRIMIALNIVLRAIQFHNFYNQIEL